MNLRAKRAIAITVPIVVVLLVVFFVAYRYAHQRSMVACTLEWGRLAPFPEGARDFAIRAEGSMFTRAFRASFAADPDVIERWLADSPGTRDATPVRVRPNTRKYTITPGGDAQGAEVLVDDEKHVVSVYVFWS